MRLKRWESPRREGRNNKGKGGAARQRQIKKQTQMMRKKLKGETKSGNNQGKRIKFLFPFYLGRYISWIRENHIARSLTKIQ